MYQMPNCLNEIIAEYAQEYKLLDWVPLGKLKWPMLSANPGIFKSNKQYIFDTLMNYN